jgi:hypothetical protein
MKTSIQLLAIITLAVIGFVLPPISDGAAAKGF